MEKSGPSDPELLAEWLEHGREAAFRTLVARYAGLVLMTARRTCGDDSLAAEASQLTFLLLASKARSLLTCASLGGWLHRAALMHSKNLHRAAQSEACKREKLRAAMIPHPPATPDDPWQDLQPVLDEALATLPDKYREALLLRFYRSLGVREVGETLGISTDAAQKRIDRGTSRLRDRLARLGCPVAGTSLGALLLAGFTTDVQAAVAAAPILATKVLAASAAGSTAAAAGSSTFITALAMKASSYVVPATLVLALAWLGSQRLAMAKLESGNAALSAKLASVGAPAKTRVARKQIPTALDKKPVDWVEVVRELTEYEGAGDAVYLTTKLPLHDDFRAMTREDLLAALDQVGAAGLSKQQREVLEAQLYKNLLEKDPQAALDQASARGFSQRTKLLGDWAAKDPKSASAWLDAQIAAGSLTAKSLDGGWHLREALENEVMRWLIPAQPEEAIRRMATLPEHERTEILDDQSLKVQKKDWPAFARVLRAQVSSRQRLAILSQMIRWRDSTSLVEMHDFLEQGEATPEERETCILAMAGAGVFLSRVSLDPKPGKTMDRKVASSEDLDTLRAWVSKEAPELVEQASAATLTSLLGHMKYGEVVDLALHCHAAGGSDEVLMAVMDYDHATKNPELARSVADKLSDPAKRRKVMKMFEPSEAE